MSDSEAYEVPTDAVPVDSTTEEAPPIEGAAPPGIWSRSIVGTGRLFLRFAFVYLLLFAYPFPLSFIPDVRAIPQVWHDSELKVDEVNWDLPAWADDAYKWRTEHLMAWEKRKAEFVDQAAAEVFGFEEQLDRPRGSGDPTYGYVEVATRAAAAGAVAFLWLLIAALVGRFTGRRDRLLDFLSPWMHVFGRYFLAMFLLSYGLAKVYPSQFRVPDLARMETPYGDGSPMNILWNFMGSSIPYIVFAGAMQVVPALLLFWRRTALLGALLGAAVMANVMVLNYCYDVPVKLFSTQLFLLACAVAAPDLKRLASMLVLNRTTPPRDLSRPRTGWIGHVVRLVILVPYLALSFDYVAEKYKHPTEPYALRGIWDVEGFKVDGAERVPRTDDALRFSALIIDRKTTVHLKAMDGSLRRVNFSMNKDGDRLTLRTSSRWTYRLEGDELVLTGEHTREMRVTDALGEVKNQLRGPQTELRLRRDLDYVPGSEPSSRRERVPKGLTGRWLMVGSTAVGEMGTRRHAPPYGWEAIEIDSDEKVRVEHSMSEHEFKVKVRPDQSAEESAAAPSQAGRLTLSSTSRFDVEEPGEDQMNLSGELFGEEVEIRLQRRDESSFLLLRRGFHWINEFPLNRY